MEAGTRGAGPLGCNYLEVTSLFQSEHLYGIKSGIIITASHNPANYNGFKIQHDGRTLFGEELQVIRKMIQDDDFEHGQGKLTCQSPVKDYISMVKEKIKLTSSRKI